MAVAPIPKGYHSLTPYLFVKGAAEAIDFYQKAFGAKEVARMAGPNGKIMHAEVVIGDSHLMLADEMPEMGHKSPTSLGGATSSILLYVENVDKAFPKAIAAGARQVRPLEDQFWGDRMGSLADPFGHVWSLATHKEDVPPAEMQKREREFKASAGG